VLEPYLCRSFAGIENPISSYSTTVKPLMLAKFNVKKKRQKEKETRTRHCQLLYWCRSVNKCNKVK